MTAPDLAIPYPDLRRRLDAARGEHLMQVVALLDAMPRRGDADALLAPLRARLAALAPVRPLTPMRLLFRPLDPVITPGPRWRPGHPSVPRSALACLGNAILRGLGPAGQVGHGLRPGVGGDAWLRAGAALWPAAAAALDAMEQPPDWSDATGLPIACFTPIRANMAAVLQHGERLAQLDTADLPGLVGAILADTMARRPAGLGIVLAALLAHGGAAALLAGSRMMPGGAPPLPPGKLDLALAHAMDRAEAQAIDVLPVAAPRVAARTAEALAVLAETLDQPGSRPDLRARAVRLREAAHDACCGRLTQAVAADLATRLSDGPADDATVEELEYLVRDLRRLARAGRRLGPAPAYDTLLLRVAGDIGRLPAAALSRIDRLRLTELLVGAAAALRLVPELDCP